MDLDALAGVIAYKHTGEHVMTVTAAVDRITLKHPLSTICDLELSGQVTFATGRSSMEVSLQVAKVPEAGQSSKESDVLMTCAFTMVYPFLLSVRKAFTDPRQRYLLTLKPKRPSQLAPSRPLPQKKNGYSQRERRTITSKKPPPS